MAKREMGKLLGGALGLAAFGGLIAAPQPAAALTINANFTNFGSNADEQNVFEAAIQWWEMIITTPFTFNVTVNRFDFINDGNPNNNGTLGQTSGFTEDGTTKLPTGATVDMGICSDWFIDPTPHEESEFTQISTDPPVFTANAGGPAANKFDFLSVAKHELGHALGFTVNYTKFAAQVGAESGGKRAFGGGIATLGPASAGTHLDAGTHPDDLMVATIGAGKRRLQSNLDCAVLTKAFGYECSTALHKIPEPSTVFLLAIALLGLAGLHAAPRLRRAAG